MKTRTIGSQCAGARGVLECGLSISCGLLTAAGIGGYAPANRDFLPIATGRGEGEITGQKRGFDFRAGPAS